MSPRIARLMLISLTPVLALTGAGRPVRDARLLAQAAIEAAARSSTHQATDDDASQRSTPVIVCVDDPWDRVVRTGGTVVGVEPITVGTSFCAPAAPPALADWRMTDAPADYTPAQLTHLARLWSCGPPIA